MAVLRRAALTRRRFLSGASASAGITMAHAIASPLVSRAADRPVPAALTLGALVDLLHLASMLGLAVVVPRHRRCALLDAAAAAAWAAAGVCAPRSGAPGGSRTAVGTARNHIASMLAVRR